MKSTLNDELLGSCSRAASNVFGPELIQKVRKFFRDCCHQKRSLQISNQKGGQIYLLLVNYSKEEIGELIMENNESKNCEKNE